jgi:hypothetical protein
MARITLNKLPASSANFIPSQTATNQHILRNVTRATLNIVGVAPTPAPKK